MPADSNRPDRQQVVVVTGGGAGIGAAIAEAVGRTGAYVVTVDPGVTVDGLGQDDAPGETTADRIVAAGGTGAGVERVGHRRGGDRRALHGPRRRVRRPRRGDQRRRDQPSDGLRRGRRGGLGVGAECAPRRVSQRVALGAADHRRGRTGPDPRGHLWFRMATRQCRRVQLREARGRRPHLAARERSCRPGSRSTRCHRSRRRAW